MHLQVVSKRLHQLPSRRLQLKRLLSQLRKAMRPLPRRLRLPPTLHKICSKLVFSSVTSQIELTLYVQLAQQQQQQQAAANPLGGGAGMSLQQLANSPQGAQMRQIVEQNPALLQPLLQQLAAANPGLAQAMAANPEMLFQLLAQSGAASDMEGEEGDLPAGGLPPGTHVIELTEQERAAVQRVS